MLSLGIHKDSWQLKQWIQSQGNFLEGLGSDSEAVLPSTPTHNPNLPPAGVRRPTASHVISH